MVDQFLGCFFFLFETFIPFSMVVEMIYVPTRRSLFFSKVIFLYYLKASYISSQCILTIFIYHYPPPPALSRVSTPSPFWLHLTVWGGNNNSLTPITVAAKCMSMWLSTEACLPVATSPKRNDSSFLRRQQLPSIFWQRKVIRSPSPVHSGMFTGLTVTR